MLGQYLILHQLYNNFRKFVMQVILKHDEFYKKCHVVQDKQKWIDGVVILKT